jgi:uncharacterized protein YqkB
MQIVIDDVTYHITDVVYEDDVSTIFLTVSETLIDQTLTGEDFLILYRSGIEDFYSNDDEAFRVDFYFQSFGDGTGTEKLLYTTFLVQDGVTEDVTDQTHIISLKSTDNLALLKNVSLVDARPDDYDNPFLLWDYIREALQETGLYNSIDANSIPLILYNNLFENSTDDRSIDDINEPFRQLILYSKAFQDNDGSTYDDLYTIISDILIAFNASLLQASGAWNVVRMPEYSLFSGAIPGTELTFDSGEVETAVTLDPLVTIGHNTGDCQPVAEDQVKSLQRAIRLDKTTFDYNQPVAIKQNNLQIEEGATPYYTDTTDDIRTDRYDIPTYFPNWIQRGGVTSYLEVKTDVATDIEREQDRYIVIIGDDSLTGGVQFNPIPVSAGDKFHFSLQWRTDTDTDDLIRFWVRFIFITASATNYTLHDEAGTGNDKFRWVGPNPATLWDTDDGGIRHEINNPDDQDTTEWMEWNLEQSQFSEESVPPLPAEDGILLIEVRGTDAGSATDRQNIYFKDIVFEAEQLVSKSTQIVGQTHTNTDDLSEAKKIEEEEVLVDDSPSNTIAGTLFTNLLTDFEYTDSTTGQDTDIGSVYFTRTRSWHRGEIDETRRLGDIITAERLFMKQNTRLIIDGTFRNVRYDNDKFISPLCLFEILFYEGKFFVASSISIDYMDCTFKARLIEIFNDEDDNNADYLFKFKYDVKR